MRRREGDPIICTVDVVLLTLRDDSLCVLLLKRDREPFAGALALPGGYVRPDEDQDAAAAASRVLREKTGLVSPYLEQLATFSGPARDPRGWSVSVVYFALVPSSMLQADPPGVELLPVARLPRLPFDHGEIVREAVARLRAKSQYSSLPVYLCPERFTLPQLQAVYEAVLGEPINKVSFRRKMDELGMLEPIPGELEVGRAHRPAQLYRLRPEYRHALSMVDRGINARG
ncbi:NUDIX hydrolase [Caldimonas brevitalea]|uniref:NUDIX hydrolase n=1 Tax=Caldimonas brevitalea TaxID=413882 RepID=A0A0G3BNU0_9BURK|nr:NUDIX domain-containing protein [Caldimonas brevitalea]AKJ28215.1 NUDIX hydrolase [Caldimonas brevitalea]